MLPKRKVYRLASISYQSPGAYFITVCTQNRRNLFWNAVGATIGRPQDAPLSSAGKIVDAAICAIPDHYPAVAVDYHVVMPNHIHLLLQIKTDASGRAMPAPTISTVVQQLKGSVSKQLGGAIWQKSFYDHVVRSAVDYQEIAEYILSNPAKWAEDRFYTK